MAATTIMPAKKASVVKDKTTTAKSMRLPNNPYNIPMDQKPKSKKGEPIDPDELSRRLQTYLTQQKMRAEERKQRAAYKATHAHSPPNVKSHHQHQKKQSPPPSSKQRPESFGAEKEGSNNGYRHVPSQAAAQFARTTTPDPMRAIHTLSQPAVEFHLEQIKLGEPFTGVNTMQAINNARAERAALRQRNQFQLTKSMEEVNIIDDQRGVHGHEYQKYRHSLLMDEEEEDESPRSQRPRSKVLLDMSGRDKWAQEDEKSSKDAAVVRRKPSSWILLGRKSSKNEKDEAVAGVGGPMSPTTSDGKSSRGFLARFRRHAV